MENIAHVLGIIAIVVSVLSMVFKNKSTIMLYFVIYNILVLTSYLLLGKFLGCILVGVLTLKSITYYVFSIKKIKPNIFALIFFEIAIVTISIILWSFWVDVFIILNSIIATYFSWQDNVKLLKVSAIFCAVLLILYDIFVGAYAFIISEVLYGMAALFSLIYMLKQNGNINKNENTIKRLDK